MKWWVLLFILPLVNAAGIDTAITTAVLGGSLAEITSQYVIISEGVEPLFIYLPADVQSVNANMDGTLRECKIENSTALCGSTKADQHVFTISYITSSVIGTLQERTLFRFNEQLPFKTSDHTFILKLPVGTIIPQEEGKETDFFLTPKPAQVLSDGQRIIITWKSNDATEIAISAVLQPLESRLTLVALIVIAAVLGGGATWYFLKHKKSKPAKPKRKAKAAKTKEDLPLKEARPLVPQFVADEQKVVELLINAPNQEAWQKETIACTDALFQSQT